MTMELEPLVLHSETPCPVCGGHDWYRSFLDPDGQLVVAAGSLDWDAMIDEPPDPANHRIETCCKCGCAVTTGGIFRQEPFTVAK